MTMEQFKRHGVHVAMGLALLAWCGTSQGLGLGQGGSQVTMGEGLSFDAPLRLAPGEHLDDDCLSADVYFGDDKVAGFKVAVTLSTDRQGAPAIHVATSSRVDEPVVTVYVAAGCLSHVTRKYVVLADPPGLPMPALSPLSPASPAAADWAIASADAPEPAHPRKRMAITAPRSGSAHQGRARAWAQQGGAPSPASGHARSSHRDPQPMTEAARLQIDPVAADALVVPTLRMGSTLSLPTDWEANSPALRERRATAAAYWRALQAAPENWAQDQARLAELERRVVALQSLRDQVAAARQASAVAPAASAASPRYVRNDEEVQRIRIVGLIGVALFGLAAWGRMRWREREAESEPAQNWWQGWLDGGQAADPAPVAEPRLAVMPAAVPMPLSQGAQVHGQQGQQGGASARLDGRPGQVATAEELIDLAQQVELFVMLGQDDAAQELLEGHVQQAVGGSPLPFLLLLELQHRRNQRPGYERTRQALETRCQAQAPSWAHAEQLQGRSLADMPTAWARVQAACQQPEQARAVLAELICQPSEAGEHGFGLLAYRDAMSAYNGLATSATSARRADGPAAPMPAAHAAAHEVPASRAMTDAGSTALSC